MNKQLLAATLLASMMTGSVAHAANEATSRSREKCYGVSKAGKNDCASKDGSNSCTGKAKKDGNANDWVFVPKGLCDKLVGGIKE